jgi:SAM-dependent methyltransferase
MLTTFDRTYWDNRYIQAQTGWDAGAITTPLKEYFDQFTNKNLSILIPGAGNSYEAEYLFQNGFTDVTVLDISPLPLQNIKKRVPEFPDDHLICEDFFDHMGSYDRIIEQTFFCALDPALRSVYARKMYSLLRKGGKLAGVFFDDTFPDGPPFGGNRTEYLEVFRPFFKINVAERCYNSISPRMDRELFIILEKP